MWNAETQKIEAERVEHFTVLQENAALTYRQTIDLWRNNEAFRRYFNSLLAAATFSAFRWETPAVTTSTLDRAFEFVLVNSPSLSRPVDQHAFRNQFEAAGHASVLTFSNLSGDATMVAPAPVDPADDFAAYGHLAAFVRSAPAEQQQALWKATGDALHAAVNDDPVWLSTAGAGVSWLHMRLDSRPKYYSHRAYRSAP